jgi:cell division transport system permease protein
MALKNSLHRWRYFCTDAWDEWRHSLGTNLMAMLTLVSALFIAGLVILIVSSIEQRVEMLRDDVRVEIYLQQGQEEAARRALLPQLQGHGQVQRVEYVSKDEALRRYREWASDLADLVGDLESNPLPASLEIYVEPGDGAGEVAAGIAASLRNDARVEAVRYNEDWRRRLESVLALARAGGGAIVLLVFVAVVFVMGSVLRLAVLARRDEIEIMQLVGATPGFIRGPYLVAGAMQGIVAAGLALALVETVRSAALASASSSAAVLLDLVAARPMSLPLAGLLVLLGLMVGVTGSYVSVRRAT